MLSSRVLFLNKKWSKEEIRTHAFREVSMFRKWTVSLVLLSAFGVAAAAAADKQYGPGVTDTEIKIGQTMAYSGPASSYGTLGRAEAAYFAMVNDQGGIDGRKINFISRDDGYSPPKTVEMVRQLVEQDAVLALFQTIGTPPNTAIRDYMNENKVPQLFVATGANKWNDPKHYPWTMGWQPSYQIEARIYAKYILRNAPDAKIAILYQNDDYGKDYLIGLRQGLGDKADKMIVAMQTYETTDATVDSQIVALRASGANVMVTGGLAKFAAQGIRKIYDIGWRPMHFLTNTAASVKLTMEPAGAEKGIGVISSAYVKDPTDPQWHATPEYKEWLAWMRKYYPSGSLADSANVYAYTVAQTMVAVLKQCGDDLTRENLMKQAASIDDLKLPMLLSGITVSTSATDFAPIKQMRLSKFDGKTFELFGDVISSAGN
jgi:branched-chain amino acid transport system substrate-binding protein